MLIATADSLLTAIDYIPLSFYFQPFWFTEHANA